MMTACEQQRETREEKNSIKNSNINTITNTSSGFSKGGSLFDEVKAVFLTLFLGFWRNRAERFGYRINELHTELADHALTTPLDILVLYIPVPWLVEGKYRLWRVVVIDTPFLNAQVKGITLARAAEMSRGPGAIPGHLIHNETIFFIARQVEGVRHSARAGSYRFVIWASYKSIPVVLELTANAIRRMVKGQKAEMIFAKPVTLELMDTDLEFCALLEERAREIRKANIERINNAPTELQKTLATRGKWEAPP